jgi:hypothetical protein
LVAYWLIWLISKEREWQGHAWETEGLEGWTHESEIGRMMDSREVVIDLRDCRENGVKENSGVCMCIYVHMCVWVCAWLS